MFHLQDLFRPPYISRGIIANLKMDLLINITGSRHIRELQAMKTRKNTFILICLFLLVIAGPAYARSDTWTFAVYGDSQTNNNIHEKIAGLIVKARPDAVFHTGDMVERANSSKDWDAFNRITAEMRAKAEFFPAIGTHDNNPAFFFRNFPYLSSRRWYSVEKGGVHFIILDSQSKLEPGSQQYCWLEADLKSAGNRSGFKAVILHNAVFSSGGHEQDPQAVRYLVPLLERHRVDVVFSGHDHHYERSYRNGIYYIVNGGGGAGLRGRKRANPYSQLFKKLNHYCLVSVSGGEMKVDVYDIDSRLIDSFKIPKRPGI